LTLSVGYIVMPLGVDKWLSLQVFLQ